MWNLVFLFAGFFLTVLLLIVFLTKEKVHFVENRIFQLLALSNFVGYISEIMLQIAVRSPIENETIFTLALGKIYLVYIFVYMGIFSIYTFLVTRKINSDEPTDQGIPYDKTSQYKRMRMIHIIIISITVIITLILPIRIFYEEDVMYSYGMSVNFLRIILTIYTVIWIMRLILNYKMMRSKKAMPILTIILLLFANVILQAINPTVLIATFTMTFTCYVLFFTIENPDLKMLRKVQLANNQLEKALKIKEDFISSMNHEIRTPLNAIMTFTTIASESEDIKEVRELAKDSEKAGKQILEQINDVLRLQEIGSGTVDIIVKEYNPVEIFNDVVAIVKPQMDEKKLTFNINLSTELPDKLYGDAVKIKQILTNLLTNATKYTEKGHIDLYINCTKKDDTSYSLVISVKDTGIGINKEDQNRLFNKFERLEEVKNSDIAGFGLGLAITKDLVELMNGKIEVKSEKGLGSLFTVYLDQEINAPTLISNLNINKDNNQVQELEKMKSETKEKVNSIINEQEDLSIHEYLLKNLHLVQNPNEHPVIDILVHDTSLTDEQRQLKIREFTSAIGRKEFAILVDETGKQVLLVNNQNYQYPDYAKKRVLVVDDKEENLKVAKLYLEKANIEVTTSFSGKDTLAKIHSGETFDLILADIKMPEMSGSEMLEILKSENYQVPIISLTAFAMADDPRKFKEMGFADYIPKPIDRNDLYNVLDKFLK